MWRTADKVERGLETWANLNAITDTTGAWQVMAARDGALAIYHFGNTIEAIRKNLPKCPALGGLVDHSILRDASKSFRDTS